MKHTKHLLVLWAALLLGAGNAWGATETVLWADGTYVSSSITWTSANFTILQEKGSFLFPQSRLFPFRQIPHL